MPGNAAVDYRHSPWHHPRLRAAPDPYSKEEDMARYGAECIAFVGNKGAGKSLSATAGILQATAEEIMRGIAPKPIFSNLHLNVPFEWLPFPEVTRGGWDSKGAVDVEATFKNFPWFKIQKSRLLISEAHTLLDSRYSSSAVNRFGTYYITQVRKVFCDVYLDLQVIERLDPTVRGVLDWAVRCTRIETAEGPLVQQDMYQAPFLDESLNYQPDFTVYLPMRPVWPYFTSHYVILPWATGTGPIPTKPQAAQPAAKVWSSREVTG